jgi:hypothetical protein
MKQAADAPLLVVCFMLNKFLMLKMETACSSRKTVTTHQTTQFHNPEDHNIYSRLNSVHLKKCRLLKIFYFDEKSSFAL